MQVQFNGQLYKLESLINLSGFGYQKNINTDDLKIVEGSQCVSKLPICYIHNGVPHVLAGIVDTSREIQTVCFLTKHILKKALVTNSPALTTIGATTNTQKSDDLSDKVRRALAILEATIKKSDCN